MLARFTSKKKNILGRLNKPSGDYQDLSPKGDLDVEIRELVDEINNLPGYVTTSSCAGRVAVYLEGEAKRQNVSKDSPRGDSAPGEENMTSASTGGKGGGRWLFMSHEAVDLKQCTSPGALLGKLGLPRTTEIAFPPPGATVRFVRLKFEAMILHVMAGSAESAQTMLAAGMAAGFRESGISGIVDSKGRASVPMVAIRSSGLSVDCVIGFLAPASGEGGESRIQLMVSEQYLRTVMEMTNERFSQNVERKERFRHGLLVQFANAGVVPQTLVSGSRRSGAYQSRAEKAAQKRAEYVRARDQALERRERAMSGGGAMDGAAEHEDDESEATAIDFETSLFMEEGGNAAHGD